MLKSRIKENIKAISLVLFIIASAKFASTKVIIAVNQSTSLKGKIFLGIKGSEVSRGNIVIVQLQNNAHYGNARFTKIVTGVPGDIIEKQADNFFINGEFAAYAKKNTPKQTPLQSLEVVGNKIPENHFFLTTKHENSYDSRYDSFGYIPSSWVIARAYRIF